MPLYGFKEMEVLDDQDRTCELATLSDDGKTLVGKGGTGIGYLDVDGKWTDKTKLKAVNLEGVEIQPVPSSFAAPIELAGTATVDDYLDHSVRLVYRLERDAESSLGEALLVSLKQGAIYKFNYSYRGGLEWDVGFMLMNESSEVFFLVAVPSQLEFVGLQQVAAVVDDPEQAPDAADLMDFGMI